MGRRPHRALCTLCAARATCVAPSRPPWDPCRSTTPSVLRLDRRQHTKARRIRAPHQTLPVTPAHRVLSSASSLCLWRSRSLALTPASNTVLRCYLPTRIFLVHSDVRVVPQRAKCLRRTVAISSSRKRPIRARFRIAGVCSRDWST